MEVREEGRKLVSELVREGGYVGRAETYKIEKHHKETKERNYSTHELVDTSS